MIPLKWKAKKFIVGNSSAIIIPKAIADLLDDKEYMFEVKENV